MKRIALTIFVLFSGAIGARAQTAVAYPVVGLAWHQPETYVPNVNTAVTTQDSLVGHLHLANKTGSTVVVTLSDTSTNCNGAACQFWPAIPISGNTVYDNDFGGMLVTGGVQWSANTQNAVVGYLRGNYVLPILALTVMLPSPFGALAVPVVPMLVARADPWPIGKTFSKEGMRTIAAFP